MLNLQQKQSLQQKLSPQQIQYIKLLQLPTLALEQRIKAELEINPLLEEGEEEAEAEATQNDEAEVTKEQEKEDSDSTEEEYQWEELLDNSDDLYGYKAKVDRSNEEDRPEIPMPAQESILEKLKTQLAFLELNESEQLVSDQILGSVDEDGYLRRPLESIIDDIAFNHGILLEESDIEQMLDRIQRLDPIGIASRDLRECLLVQLTAMSEETQGRDVAIEMLERAYKEFTMKHYDAIMRRLRIEGEKLKEAYDLVQRLDPKPGEGFFSMAQNYITPDFTVQYEEDEGFIISLNNANAPQLRVSRSYRQMLEQLLAEKRSNKKSYDTETKQFLKSKFEAARWFINSINQRRQTMVRVMDAIVQQQENFFKLGEGHLKPMILKDVAELIEMDISTISRVVNGKYVQTDFGVYELKYFFSEGLSTDSGEDISNKEVKAIIDGIISEEDKKKPFSDQRIATLLTDRGFKIARRTVTKYREQLGIPVARLRKEILLS